MSDKKKQLPKITHLPKIVESRIDSGMSNKPNNVVRYEVFNSLGRGGFAQCFRVIQMQSKRQFALKVIDKHSENMKKNGAFQRLKNEVNILSTLKHDNIVKLYSSFQDTHNFYLVMELCQKISLVQMCRKRDKLLELQVKYFIKQIVKALLYLKQRKIIHRDVKTPNILLDQNLDIKLGDFGLAIAEDCKDRNQRYSHCGTPSYMAPQVVKRHKYSYQVDMWSVGVVTFYMLYGVHPFSHKEQKDTYEKIEKLDYKFPQPKPDAEETKPNASYQAIDFIKRIFVLDPKDRLTPQQALYHPFLRDYIPTRLPTQSYTRMVPLYILLTYCKQSNQQLLHPPANKNKKQNRYMVTRNRSITDYFQQPNNQPLQNTLKTTKKQRMTRKKQQKMVQQKKKQLIDLLQKREKNKQLKQEQNKVMDKFQVKIEVPQKQQQQNLYQNVVKQQFISQENNIVQHKSLINPEEPVQQKQNKSKKQNDLVKIQENQYKNNSRYICQSQSEQNNKELSNEKKEGKLLQNRKQYTDQDMEIWLDEKLQQQVYIYEFVDNIHLYGILIHLSNGIKLVKFNDKSIIAINQDAKRVLFLQNIKSQVQETEKLFYKLVIDQKLQECKDNLSVPVKKIRTKSAKYTRRGQKYHTVLFRSTEQPLDENILKKYDILKQFCHNCGILKTKTKLPSSKAQDEDELYNFATIIHRWGYQRSKDSGIKNYLFITKTFYQVCFDSDTQYFITKKNGVIIMHKFNKNELQKKTFVFPISDKNKYFTRKQEYEIQFIHQIVKNFTNQERANNGNHKERALKML